MTTFQFDQCFNDKKVIQACTEEGQAIALRLPRDLWGKPDPELLAVLMKSANPVITLDRALPREHVAHIPADNPGIIVVNYSRDIPRTITTGEAGKILRKFKQRMAAWPQLSVQSSIVEITEKSAEVWHVDGNDLVSDGYLEFDDDGHWIMRFLHYLQENAQRQSKPSSGQTNAPSS